MYERFADIYDRLMYDMDYESYCHQIIDLCKITGVQPDNVLEFGCGTGNLTKLLAKRAGHVTAVDLSVEMLNVAYEKLAGVSNVQLIHEDMISFCSQARYDLVVAPLDCINYILHDEDLKSFFVNVAKHLASGGAFAFDLNSEDRMKRRLGNETYVYEHDGIFYSWENEYNEETELVYMNLNFFVLQKDGTYQRIEEEQIQRFYMPKKILQICEKTGFFVEACRDLETEKEISEKTQRIFYFMNKM